MSNTAARRQTQQWNRFEHPVAFWLGAAACTAGVALHLPMYYSARDMGYRMAGMRPDAEMLTGMALIIGGLAAALYGLLPRGTREFRQAAAGIRVRALDDAPIRPRHVAMLLVISVAIVIDVMKPAALAFVAPGMAKEYGLKAAGNPHGHIPVALLPLSGISGTVLGSWLWGWLADRIGRRSSILYAGLLFVTTSICGAMPGFNWNLLMCFLMGIGAGGMLPITFALLAETIPARHRSWIMVFIGGGVSGAGYVLTSWLAGALTPHYSWRILWLIGLPTGVLFIALSHWIPESPRFLLAVGRRKDAETIMAQFGAAVVEETDDTEAADDRGGGFRRLFGSPLIGSSVAISILALGVGLITYGFQLWIPTNLQHLGYTTVNSDYIVRNAALIGLPIGLLATAMYGFWSSKKTIIAFFGLLALALFGFVLAGDSLAHDHVLLTALLVVPLSGTSLVAALITVYASEVYPTRIRSRGTGLAAGITKAGGVLIIVMVVAAATPPSIAVTAIIGAAPLLIGMAVFALTSHETRSRRLEEISHAESVAASARP
ncbi:MFS transporter [Actinoallomurus soli]|uniref:MFS transporter n=1 Tax=Actinoallomurus soli TaxID=2952535 RepID=UPI002093F523|nr:MFS transporter [Actinoallomurus soli]MCO5972502.1 MFS transporter [Actinoallomurus soli]